MNLYLPYRSLIPLLPLLTVFMPSLSGQLFKEWDKTYGGTGWEELQTLTVTEDGGYIFGGITTTTDPAPGTEVSETTRDTVEWPALTGDMWIVKTDSFGNVKWDRRYGGYHQDRLWCIAQTPDGGFILGGESISGIDIGTEHTEFNRGGFDFWLLKIDAGGNYVWDRTYGGPSNDIMRVVIPLQDGFMLFGYSNSDSNLSTFGEKTEDSRGQEDYWIVRTDLDGDFLWDKTIGGDARDFLYDAKQLPDGNFVLSGWSESSAGSGEKQTPNYGLNDYWLLKIDPDANILWQKSMGGTGEDVANDLLITQEGKILVTGFSSSPPNGISKTEPNFGNKDAWIIQLRDEGDDATVEWQRSVGGSADDLSFSAAYTNLGNLFVVGVSSSQPDSSDIRKKQAPLIGANDFWAIYLSPTGEKRWDYSIGGLNTETCTKITRAHDYGFIFGGHSSSMSYPPHKTEDSRGGPNDMWVVRTGCLVEPPELEDLPKVCADDFITIDATLDSCDFCDYIWDDGFSGPVRQYSGDTTFSARLTIVHPDGCEVEDSITIGIIPGITDVHADYVGISCYGEEDAEYFVEEVVGGTGPYQFSFDGGEWEEQVHYSSLPPGIYTLEVLDSNGCTFDTSIYIDQPEQVLAELGDDIYLDFGDSVQLQALTNLTDSFTFEWGQPQHLSCTDCLTPWVKPAYTTVFSITIRDANGCAASDHLRVILEREKAVFIPNAFSPNNDNINDFFTIYTDATVRKVNHLYVFDRWGELLFEQFDFPPNVDQLGWDGRRNGRFMQPQVFTYRAEVEYIDGQTETFYGDFTLVR